MENVLNPTRIQHHNLPEGRKFSNVQEGHGITGFILLDHHGDVWCRWDACYKHYLESPNIDHDLPMRFPFLSRVGGLLDIKQISTGVYVALALDVHGHVWKLGFHSNSSQYELYWLLFDFVPEKIDIPSKIVKISCEDVSLALDEEGQLWEIGFHPLYQKIEFEHKVKDIFATRDYHLVIDFEKRTWIRGDNEFGQLQLPSPNSRAQYYQNFVENPKFRDVDFIIINKYFQLYKDSLGNVFLSGKLIHRSNNLVEHLGDHVQQLDTQCLKPNRCKSSRNYK